MGDFFSMLFETIVELVEWFSELFIAIFVALWDILRDLAAWIFDQFLSVVVAALGSVSVGPLQTLAAQSAIPAEIGNLLGLLGVGTAISIILAAIAIRLVLQLIPFTRLGS